MTDTNIIFMITIPPTTSEIATRPGRAVKRTREMLSQKLIASSAVSAPKLFA